MLDLRLNWSVIVILLLIALAAFDSYNSYGYRQNNRITGAAVAEDTTTTVVIEPGWNIIGANTLQNVISTTCSGDQLLRTAYIYNSHRGNYDLHELVDSTYNLGQDATPTAAAWLYNYGDSCSITSKLKPQTGSFTLSDGWNMLAVQPDWQGKKLSDISTGSTCKASYAWLYDSATGWKLMSDDPELAAVTDLSTLTPDLVGKGFWVNVEKDCNLKSLQEKAASEYKLNSNVFILEDDRTFDKTDTAAITKKFYEKYPDKYDFISIHYRNGNFGCGTGAGGVQSNTKGNYGPKFLDETNSFGSKKLLGYIRDCFDFNKMYVERDPNNSPIDLIDNVYFTLLFHELTHYWGVSLPTELNEATADSAHFRGLTGSWIAVKPTTRQKFIESPEGKYYYVNLCSKEPKHHDFDLYSMGLKSPSEIKEKLIIGSEGGYSFGVPTSKCDIPVEVPSDEIKRVFTIQDFINVLGPRIPSVEYTQKDFNIAFVMIVPKGETLSQKQIDALNWIADKFPIAWYKSTEGRSTLNGIKPADTTPPVISNVKVSATKSSITVTWTTNEPTASFVIYTFQIPYEGSVIYPNIITNPPKFSTNHEITIQANDWSPIKANVEYPVKVISIDEDYNMASFDAGTVKTQS